MKKLVLIVLILAVVCGGLFAQGKKITNPVLFENGRWNSELGTVTFTVRDGAAGDGVFEGGLYKAKKSTGAMLCFQFAQAMDFSEYRGIVIEYEEKTAADMGWWTGGQIWVLSPEFDDRGSGTKSTTAMFGYWNDTLNRGNATSRMNFTAGALDAGPRGFRMDAKNIIGFTQKSTENNGQISIKRVTLVK